MNFIYVISLPRSGSTLLQRILDTSNNTFSYPETWFLLSLNSIDKNKVGLLPWGFKANKNALESFYKRINIFDQDLFNQKLKLYKKIIDHKKEKKYFIEKTPRNILLIKEILRSLKTFNNDKVILLERDTYEVFNSYCTYFDNFPFLKSFKFYREISYYNKLMEDAKELSQEYKNVIVINYNQLVSEPSSVIKNLKNFTNLDISEKRIDTIKLDDNLKFHGDTSGANLNKIQKRKSKNFLTKGVFEILFKKKITFKNIFLLPLILLSYIIYFFNPIGLKVLTQKKQFIH